ncbi:MAG: tetratricopeptide repeat protein [Proteobacteria bacterium]|nr:tetratricopeptide repeat protein [Pseudomonadota bacterium]
MAGDRDHPRSAGAGRGRSAKSEVDAAVQAHLAAGTPAEAAALLAQYARYEDAGRTLLQHLGVAAEQVGELDEPRRKLARLAASYLAKTAAAPLAVQILISLGDPVRAAEVLERSGDLLGAQKLREQGVRRGAGRGGGQAVHAVGGEAVSRDKALQLERAGQRELAAQVYVALKQYGDAGRVMRELGQPAAAAKLYVEGHLPFEAAVCYLQAGDTGKGMENLVRVPRGDARYRHAARLAVQVARQLQLLNFQLEHFLSDFVRQGPSDEQERGAFLQLAELYLHHDAPDSAKEALRRLLDRFPGDTDALTRLQQIEQSSRRSSALMRHIGEQDSDFFAGHGRGSASEILPGLPALPDLPGGPMVGAAGTRLGLGAQGLTAAPVRGAAQAATPAPVATAAPGGRGGSPGPRWLAAPPGRGARAPMRRETWTSLPAGPWRSAAWWRGAIGSMDSWGRAGWRWSSRPSISSWRSRSRSRSFSASSSTRACRPRAWRASSRSSSSTASSPIPTSCASTISACIRAIATSAWSCSSAAGSTS